VYKLLGADRRIKRMFVHYQVFQCLVKFDVFFWVAFSVQFIFLALSANSVEYIVTIAALPVSLLLLIEGHLAARYENKWLMGTFMFCSCGGCFYLSYKLVKILIDRGDSDLASVWKMLTLFSGFCIVLLLITLAWAGIVWYNFNNGLKDHLGKKNKRLMTPSTRVREQDGEAGFRNPYRMSIE